MDRFVIRKSKKVEVGTDKKGFKQMSLHSLKVFWCLHSIDRQ